MQLELNNVYVSTLGAGIVNRPIENYAEILQTHGIEYVDAGYYLQVGEISLVQGWILHTSIVRSQIVALLEILVPFLVDKRVPFKIARDKETARNFLDGNLGNAQVGKVISIYPNNDVDANCLAKDLIALTGKFKGPNILTDIHLGAIIYTRYGGFNPVIKLDETGNEVKFIYDQLGALIKDEYHIPFKMPAGLVWPFADITIPAVPTTKKILHQIYKPIKNLKTDPRGDVVKALYLRKIYDVRWCVIKQGTKNMWSDDQGRDIPDRLLWQQELHDQLGSVIPIPKVLDLFYENDNAYLAIEYCKGKPLHNRIMGLNRNAIAWKNRPTKDQLIVLGYISKIIEILDKIHQKGFVHRDVTPVNFLINKKDQLIPIDLELAYSLNAKKPDPAFALGTKGFMSPEQEALQTPTIKEDIYGLGATMIVLLTGFAPIVFSPENPEMLYENLNFFINHQPVSRMISACLHSDPQMRPELDDIENILTGYRNHLNRQKTNKVEVVERSKPDESVVKKIIDEAIHGLASPYSCIMTDDLWVSSVSVDDPDGKQKEEYAVVPGLHHGLSGVIYLLGRLKQAGFDVSACEGMFTKAWKYMRQNYLKEISTAAPGLYGGAGGVALALSNCIHVGLLENSYENREYITKCFLIENNSLELAHGIAGQGIAALQCREFVDDDMLKPLFNTWLIKLNDGLDRRGYWAWTKGKYGMRKNAVNFSLGNSGIAWFLLEYAAQYKDVQTKELAMQAVEKLCNELHELKHLLKKHGFQKTFQNKLVWDGITGIMLVLMKVYETGNNPFYKKLAEEMLLLIPACPASDCFNQEFGLAGLGELYLEAWALFRKNEWLQRAEWIANLFIHTARRESGLCYWLGNNSNFPTADLMTGNGGIIHFLMRYSGAGKIGYRLLK